MNSPDVAPLDVAPLIDSSHSRDEELVLTTTNGLVTKIERLDQVTHERKELSADEYAEVTSSYYAIYYATYYAIYYAGMGDYAQAVASGNTDLTQTYYQNMTAFFGLMGQRF